MGATSSRTVTAVECVEFGPIETLRVVERESQPLLAGQVRLGVSAAGVNFVDGLLVEGRYQIKPPVPFGRHRFGTRVAGDCSGFHAAEARAR